MTQALECGLGHVGNIGIGSVRRVILEHRNNLVVNFIAIKHSEPADRHALQDQVTVLDSPIREDAHVCPDPIPSQSYARSFAGDRRNLVSQ